MEEGVFLVRNTKENTLVAARTIRIFKRCYGEEDYYVPFAVVLGSRDAVLENDRRAEVNDIRGVICAIS